MTDDRPGPRTVVLGDSWVHGLSKGQNTMSRHLPAGIGAGRVLDLSKVSRVVPDVVADHLGEIDEFAPEVAFLAVGGADSLVFPKPFFQRQIDRFFPPEWAGIDGLQPSAMPIRDKRAYKKRLEAFAKAMLKQVLVNVFGPHRRVALDEYEVGLRQVLRLLESHGTIIVLVGVSDVDGWTSPKTSSNIRAANAVNRRLAERHPLAMYVESNPLLAKWEDYLVDHVHLTKGGHRAVTDGVLAAMTAAGGPWADLVHGAPATVAELAC